MGRCTGIPLKSGIRPPCRFIGGGSSQVSHRLIRDLRRGIVRLKSLQVPVFVTAVITASALGGCVPAGAPSIPFFGAFFPSWLLCAGIGIIGAVLVRVVLIRLGIDDVIPARLPVYVCVAAGIGFLVSIVSFGR